MVGAGFYQPAPAIRRNSIVIDARPSKANNKNCFLEPNAFEPFLCSK